MILEIAGNGAFRSLVYLTHLHVTLSAHYSLYIHQDELEKFIICAILVKERANCCVTHIQEQYVIYNRNQ